MPSLLQVLLFLSLPIFIALIDFIVIVRSKFVQHHLISNQTPKNQDFTILIPIFGNMSYLKNVDFLRPYSSHVVLCTTTKESPQFNEDITRIANENGFRIFRSNVQKASSKFKPNPWKVFTYTLNPHLQFDPNIARDEIIRDSFKVVKTKYCIFLDGDTYANDDLTKLAGLMSQKDFDVASVRILASKTDTMMEKLQAVEYELAMDCRRIYPWLTSGAASITKTDVIKEIMHTHSLYFQGGDIEIGKLAMMLGYKVGHFSFVFYTDVPETFKAWWRQRKSWFGGGFRHAVINLHVHNWKFPLFFFYNTCLVFLFIPLRWYEVYKQPLVCFTLFYFIGS
jgi:cellulose synthase/poly-beta-1,6-N-acetylglucosamine synthase-like glycosyltransferase